GAGTPDQRERLLPALTRGDTLGAVAFSPRVGSTRDAVRATRAGDDWILEGETAPVDHAAHTRVVLVGAGSAEGLLRFVIDPSIPGVRVDPPVATLGLRGLDACRIRFDRCRIPPRDRLGGSSSGDSEPLALARLGTAAIAVGLAQAAFEAAL